MSSGSLYVAPERGRIVDARYALHYPSSRLRPGCTILTTMRDTPSGSDCIGYDHCGLRLLFLSDSKTTVATTMADPPSSKYQVESQ